MYRRKSRGRNSFLLLNSSNRGSDIVKPDNTSLIVNNSETDDELPKELTSVFSEDEDVVLNSRKSASLMESLTQKTQSTPKQKVSNSGRVLNEFNCGSDKNILKKSKICQSSSKVVSKPEKKKNYYFEEVLKACGAFPDVGNTYLMREDQGIFSMKINSKLSENTENVQKFLSSLEEEIENPENFKKMLAHTLTADDCNVARGPVQEPLMRMLLNVDCLQIGLFNLLLQKLANIIIDNGVQNEDSHVISSILCQCRFLNRVKDAKITSKLFEIIHVAPVKVQKEIIFLLPEIVSEEEAEDTTNQLFDVLKLDKRLTNVVVDAIANLPLSEVIMSQTRTKMLCRLDKCPSEFLPSLVQFILNKCDADSLTQVICDLRENLPFTVKHFEIKKLEEKKYSDKESCEEDSYIKLTFENLKFSVMVSKQMVDAWIKVITAVKCCTEFRCVDLIMLIIFYNCLVGRKSQILGLIRNKIKSSVLTEVHVQDMFKILLGIAREYFSPLLELASVLLKSFEKKISDFAVVLYKECFIHFNFYKKQTVISEILLHIGTGSSETINTALDIIKNLSENETELLSRHTMSIMGLLVKIHDLSVAQFRTLLDVISELIFYKCTEETIGWRDELQIFFQKQLTSPKFDHCKKGIVGAIMFAKHAEKIRENNIISCEQINSLLELAMDSKRTEARKSFFCDEFAITVKNSQLNEKFLQIWNDKVYNMVMNNVFVQNIDVECEHFPMSLQYSLHAEGVQKLVFPLVKFVIDSDSTTPLNTPVSVIPSTLRLLWTFEQNFKRNLPVFCASVIMPEVSVFDNFDAFNMRQKKIAVDCLFLCANFLIECVNAFCSQEIIDKGLLRIKQLVSVRKIIAKCLHRFYDYSPPFCQFYMPVHKVVVKKRKIIDKKIKSSRKRKSDDIESEVLNHSVEDSQNPGTSASHSLDIIQDWEEGNLHMYRGYFREFHIFTYKLLKTDLTLKSLSEININNGDSINRKLCSLMNVEKLELTASEVLFLLEELLYKLDQILKEPKRSFNFKGKPVISALEYITPESFVVFSVEILPVLLSDIEILSSYCEDLLEANEWVYDSQGMYMPGTHDIKLALAAALRFISEIISWKGFKNSSNQSLLRDVLSILSGKGRFLEDDQTPPCIGVTAFEAANYLAGFSKNVLSLDGALSIVRAFEACLQFSSSPEQFFKLAELCFEMLSRPWFTVSGATEKGPTYNQHIDILLKTYFANVDNKLEVVRDTAKLVLSEIEQPTKNTSFMKSIKAINKGNFPLLYRAMCESLVSASATEFDKIENNIQLSLEIWSTIVDTWLVLIEIVKILPSRVNLASLLKRSQSMIQLFLSRGMPLVESVLRVKSSEILKLLKCLQTVTRFLHSVCCHSKVTNDSTIAAYVPAIRSQCEQLTLEIKGVIILNKIPMECITIAILKNRDLKGNDILSQESVDNDSDDGFEFPPEDTQIDENNVNTITETQESASEVY